MNKNGDFQERDFQEINPYVREVGLQKMDQWGKVDRRIYDHEFFYCIKGKAFLTIDEEEFTLSSGVLMLIPPNVPHRLKFQEDIQSEMYYLHFDFFLRDDRDKLSELYIDLANYQLLFLRPLTQELIREKPVFSGGYTFPTYLKVQNTEAVESIFRRLYQSYIREDEEILLKSIFLELLHIISTSNKDKDYTSQKHRLLAEEMRNYIGNNYYRKLLPCEIAREVQLSSDYANKIFKKSFSMSLSKYILYFKISMAKKLMLDKDLSIGEISNMVGFQNEFYFSKMFKQIEKHSPTTVRRMLLDEIKDGKV